MKNEYIKIRNAFKEYRLLEKELISRTAYIEEFKKIMINTLPKDEKTLYKIYKNIISDMEKNALKLRRRLRLLDNIVNKLECAERNVIYFKYIRGIDWIDMPEYMMYEQRTCQLFEMKALKKILKMNINWSDDKC